MATRLPSNASVALASATSAQNAVRAGTTLFANSVDPSSIVADCSATIASGSVVATFKWQGSADNSTWVDVHGPENAAYVTLAATGTTALACPAGATGFEYLRVAAILSGAATASGDLTAATYRARPYQR